MVSSISLEEQNNQYDSFRRPSKTGRYGKYGGQYVPETLMPALFELEKASKDAWNDKKFTNELDHLLKTYVGRETPLYEASRLTEHYKKQNIRSRIWLKREESKSYGCTQN